MSSTARHATRQRAAHDVLLQMVMRVLNLALGVVVTALLARTLGKDGYGEWSTLFVSLSLVGYTASFGMEKVVVREVAAAPEQEHEWFGAMMALRLMLLVPAVAVSLATVLVLHSSHQMLIAGSILVLGMPFDGIGVVSLVFQLRVNNLVPMLVLTLKSVLWAIVVALVFWRHGDMVELALGLVLTNGIGSIVQTLAALRVLERWPRPSRRRLAGLLKTGVSLGLSGVLIIAYARIDQVIVFTEAGTRAAGLYGAVYNMLDQAHFVPISVLTTLTPIIAASWPADRERMLRAVRLAAELLSVASLGALAFVSVAASPIVRLVFGADFVAGAPALPVLGAAYVFICFGYLNGTLLTVMGLQGRLLRISLLALAVNLAGNLVLVPIDGFMGAAWMTLATEIVVCGASLRVILRTLGLPFPRPGRVGRTVLAAGLLAAGLAGLKGAGAPLAALAAVSCLCYPALLFGVRALELSDVRLLLRRVAPA
ncbi:MAG TPA: flippase [Solirubrobacteraceae bacterium]|jgi:O-antigen/teichoic acid export membrane protein|nr:flippase [Solirubrobacteraceae bacterium]